MRKMAKLFPAAAALIMTTGTIPIEHGSLFYSYTPSTHHTLPPLLFIHAGVANSSMWTRQVSYFTSLGYPTITYDMRGYGQSFNSATAPEDASYSPTQDAIALLDHFSISKQVIVVGSSMGGAIGLDLAIEYPSRVKALVHVCGGVGGLNDPKFDETQSGSEEEKAVFKEYYQAYDCQDWDKIEDIETRVWADGVGQPIGRSGQVCELVRKMIHENHLQHQKRGEKRLKARRMNPSAAERIGELKCPVLVVVGKLDTSATIRTGEWLHRRSARSKIVSFEGCAHMVSMEEGERFNRVLSDFFRTFQYAS